MRQDCDRYADLISTGRAAVAKAEESGFQDHLEICPDCRTHWTINQLLLRHFSTIAHPTLPADFCESVLAVVELEEKPVRTTLREVRGRAVRVLSLSYWAMVAAFVFWCFASLDLEISSDAALIALAVLIPISFAVTVGCKSLIRLAARLVAPLLA